MSENEKGLYAKRNELGVTGVLIILSQIASGYHSTDKISNEIQALRLDTEKYFVRKEELKSVVQKLDRMNSELAHINRQMRSIRDISYSFYSDENETGCSNFESQIKGPLKC